MRLINNNFFMNLLMRTKYDIKTIFSPEPVIFNLILICICLSSIVYVSSSISPVTGKMHFFITHALEFVAAFQVIKSSKKSLFIPFILLLIALVGVYLNTYISSLLTITLNTYKDMLIISIISIIIGVFFLA